MLIQAHENVYNLVQTKEEYMQGVPVKKKSLEDARTELLLTQVELADRANVSISVVIGCENGRVIRRLSAQALLKALNQKRREEGEDPLTFDDLDWKIQ